MDILDFIDKYWAYLSIPAVSAIVGYGTNWLAVKMMMYPVEFVGAGPIGWQGVVPANAEKMANLLVDHSLRKVLTQQELIERVEPDKLVDALQHRIDPFIEDIVDEVLSETSNYGVRVGNLIWAAAPGALKGRVYAEVRKNMPALLARAVQDVSDNLDDFVDLNQIIVAKLGRDKRLLIDIFLTAAQKEFKFIERSGLYFGLPLGIPVMFAWYYFPVWWLLPLFGMLVGYITNALAMYLIQKPLRPVKIGPLTIQGLFLKRQKEVSAYFGKVFANELITAEIMMAEVLKTERSLDRVHELVQREVNHAIEDSQGIFKPITVLSLGPTEYAKVGRIISERAFAEILRPDKRSLRYLDEAFDIENTIADRVGNLPPAEFFELIHPVIAEDEWKLIAIGALLGLGAGWWQWALLA
ncbi:MAG: hypothetical protein H6990_08840 [Pseudomonadales bacterium]|nr:hypothetical protein [Pseudomonadales bacterium]MCP5202749.1 hypothetical protein [Pseudomonadales bacterium]